MRSRSGTEANVAQRINACFKRSMNGSPLPNNIKELKAMVAYMKWLGKDVPKGEKPYGAGPHDIEFLNRAADPQKGLHVLSKAL